MRGLFGSTADEATTSIRYQRCADRHPRAVAGWPVTGRTVGLQDFVRRQAVLGEEAPSSSPEVSLK